MTFFSFRLGEGLGATFSDHPRSEFIRHQLPLHATEVRPQQNQSCISEVYQRGSRFQVFSGPKIGSLGPSPKKAGDDITKATIITRV